MRTSFCLLAFVAYSCANAINSANELNGVRGQHGLGIIGGHEIEPHSAPYHVVVTANDAFCGGALISSTVVVTAAHCLNGAVSATVIAGAHNLLVPEPSRQVKDSEDYFVHPDYVYHSSTYMENDLALIFFKDPFVLDAAVQPLVLTASGWGDSPRMSGFLTGFGKTSPDVDLSKPAPLMGALVDIISNKECAKFFDQYENFSYNMMCTSGNARACIGDAGSPLVQNGVLIGIVSLDGCQPGYPTGYTRTSQYVDWIKEEAGL